MKTIDLWDVNHALVERNIPDASIELWDDANAAVAHVGGPLAAVEVALSRTRRSVIVEVASRHSAKFSTKVQLFEVSSWNADSMVGLPNTTHGYLAAQDVVEHIEAWLTTGELPESKYRLNLRDLTADPADIAGIGV